MKIAFFDFDRTLVTANTGKLWVRQELEAGRMRRMDALRASAWLGAYALGLATMDDAIGVALRLVAGSHAGDLESRTKAFYQREVRQLYRPGARVALEQHRAQGDRLVLLTTSLDLLARLVGEELGLDAQLCTTLEVDAQGRHTGKTVGPVCYGQGKLLHAESYAKSAGIELAECFFYTDSYSDLPVLEKVGAPVAVHPDLRLRRHAARRGWKIVEWGEPGAV